ncbi:MAG: hypothetical protein AAF236_14065 [Verrucomicrobiota bacterium]
MNQKDLSVSGSKCRIFWGEGAPEIDGRGIGMVGCFSAGSKREALALLDLAERELYSKGVTSLRGPLDGDTMHPYRFVVESDGSPSFPMEPGNPPDWPLWWSEAGWSIAEHYVSSRVELDSEKERDFERIERRLCKGGLVIRPIELDRFEEELRLLYPFLLERFSENVLFSPFSESEFLAHYLRARPLVDSRFVLVGEDEKGLAGIVFAYVDPEQRLIVKTLASRMPGLGSLLLNRVQKTAKEIGCREAIHALKHAGNASCRVSSRLGGAVFRRYALFGKGGPE